MRLDDIQRALLQAMREGNIQRTYWLEFATSGGFVVPGQPVQIDWSLNGIAPFNPGNVTARISILGNTIYTSAPIPYDLVKRTAGEKITLKLDPATPGAQDFYARGDNTLSLSVTGDGVDKGPYEEDTVLTVNDEGVDCSWWQWTSPFPPSGHEDWKAPYTVEGILTNQSKYSQFSASFVLNELDNIKQVTNFRGNANIPSVQPGHAVPAGFSPITQDWGWVGPAAIRTGPIADSFFYTLKMTLMDSYSNQYNVDCQGLAVNVWVSQDKLNWQIAAAAAAATAAAFAVAALGWPPLAVAAALAASASAAASVAANDPSFPDPNYRGEVKVVLPEFPAPEDPAISPLYSLLEAEIRVVSYLQALNRIRNKILGAKVFHSPEAVGAQEGTFREFQGKISYELKGLPDALQRAVKVVESEPRLKTEVLDDLAQSWSIYGVPSVVYRRMADFGLSELAMESLRGIFNTEVLSTLMVVPISVRLRIVVNRLAALTSKATRERVIS